MRTVSMFFQVKLMFLAATPNSKLGSLAPVPLVAGPGHPCPPACRLCLRFHRVDFGSLGKHFPALDGMIGIGCDQCTNLFRLIHEHIQVGSAIVILHSRGQFCGFDLRKRILRILNAILQKHVVGHRQLIFAAQLRAVGEQVHVPMVLLVESRIDNLTGLAQRVGTGINERLYSRCSY